MTGSDNGNQTGQGTSFGDHVEPIDLVLHRFRPKRPELFLYVKGFPHTTMAELKERFGSEKDQPAAANLVLKFNGRTLLDNETVQELGLQFMDRIEVELLQ